MSVVKGWGWLSSADDWTVIGLGQARISRFGWAMVWAAERYGLVWAFSRPRDKASGLGLF